MSALFLAFVLISTYWNVNLLNYAMGNAVIRVLISTYWNVNAYADFEPAAKFEF